MSASLDVIFEMTRIGTIMKVTAIDAETGTEVIIQGPATRSQKELQKVAARKLRYVIEKQKKELIDKAE